MGRRSRASREQPGPSGFLVVDKPQGRTSHDVVDAARRWFGTRRVGHLGTLDPQATGVLPLAIRESTKLIPYVEGGSKAYVGTIRLGVETDTLDGEGRVLRTWEGEFPALAEVTAALAEFEGEISQTPPMYSAVKKDGVPLYRLARKGQEVAREPRRVTIESLRLRAYTPPDIDIEVVCSPGTYVRSLASDLGKRLGCGAHLANLRRTRSGPFCEEHAVTAEVLDAEAAEGKVAERLLGEVEVLGLAVYPMLELEARRLAQGGELPMVRGRVEAEPGDRLAATAPDGSLVAVVELRADRCLRPLRVIRPNRASEGAG